MSIESLEFSNAGPFDKITFEFDKNVNIFIGPNNCGKSTTLLVLGEILVYPFGIPNKYFKTKQSFYKLKYKGDNDERIKMTKGKLPIYEALNEIKENKREKKLDIYLNMLTNIGYSTFIPAIRQSTDFRSEGPLIKRKPKRENGTWDWITSKQLSIDPFLENLPPQMIVESRFSLDPDLKKRNEMLNTDPLLVKDEEMIQKFIELDYLSYREDKPEIRNVIVQVFKMASEITEFFPLKFIKVDKDERGLFLLINTPDGDIPLNCLSQGTQSIVQWLSHLIFNFAEYYNFPKTLKEKTCILIIDEIDAHLHPSWQRRIIPTLINNFPNLQIFASTHSPLMLSGLKAGQVHLLSRNENGGVSVSKNDKDIIGWSSDEIMITYLKIKSPTDLQTSIDVERLKELRNVNELSARQKHELKSLSENSVSNRITHLTYHHQLISTT